MVTCRKINFYLLHHPDHVKYLPKLNYYCLFEVWKLNLINSFAGVISNNGLIISNYGTGIITHIWSDTLGNVTGKSSFSSNKMFPRTDKKIPWEL